MNDKQIDSEKIYVDKLIDIETFGYKGLETDKLDMQGISSEINVQSGPPFFETLSVWTPSAMALMEVGDEKSNLILDLKHNLAGTYLFIKNQKPFFH